MLGRQPRLLDHVGELRVRDLDHLLLHETESEPCAASAQHGEGDKRDRTPDQTRERLRLLGFFRHVEQPFLGWMRASAARSTRSVLTAVLFRQPAHEIGVLIPGQPDRVDLDAREAIAFTQVGQDAVRALDRAPAQGRAWFSDLLDLLPLPHVADLAGDGAGGEIRRCAPDLPNAKK